MRRIEAAGRTVPEHHPLDAERFADRLDDDVTSLARVASFAGSSARRSSSNHDSRARTLMPSPPPIRPTFTDVPSTDGIAAMSETRPATALIALGTPGASHACPPGPVTVMRRRTEPTPIADTPPK